MTRVVNITVELWQRKMSSLYPLLLGLFVLQAENPIFAMSVIVIQNLSHMRYFTASCLYPPCYHAPCIRMEPPKAKRTHEVVIQTTEM